MKTTMKTLIAGALAATALFASLPASAGDRGWDRDDYREWRGGPPGHAWGHHKHWKHKERYYVERERVIVRERPVYYYQEPVRYYAPPPPRYYSRDPAIVVGVDIPPLVFPLR